MRARSNLFFGLLAAAAVIAYLLSTSQDAAKETEAKKLEEQSAAHAVANPEAAVGGPFTLINQDGKTVTEKDYKGKYLLLTFGFTYCPDICPTKLQEMSLAINGLGPEAKWVQPIMITVDPQRDTPAQLKTYVGLFPNNIQGLTGTPEQIAAVAKSFKIFYKRTEPTSDGNYSMDHSSQIFLMDQNGKFLDVFGDEAEPAQITAAMRQHIPQHP